MKNQNDLIISIVAIVFGLIGVGIFYGTKPQAKTEAPPTAVNTAEPKIEGAEVKMANNLPGGGGGTAGGGTGRFGGGGGGRGGFGGPPPPNRGGAGAPPPASGGFQVGAAQSGTAKVGG